MASRMRVTSLMKARITARGTAGKSAGAPRFSCFPRPVSRLQCRPSPPPDGPPQPTLADRPASVLEEGGPARGGTPMITVSGKILGKKQRLFTDWSIPFPPDLGDDAGRLTLRDLRARVVRAEVAAFGQRQQERRLVHALAAADTEKGVVRGKVDMGGRAERQTVDEEEAVSAALQAFEDGLYLVILDEKEQRDLDREVFVKPDSRVTFVRPAMLAGG